VVARAETRLEIVVVGSAEGWMGWEGGGGGVEAGGGETVHGVDDVGVGAACAGHCVEFNLFEFEVSGGRDRLLVKHVVRAEYPH
jgi:hypothetical protein